jgi:hypothetical protein
LPARIKHAGLPRRGLFLSLAAAFMLIALVGATAVPAHAADDSNAGQLTQVPTVSPQQLSSTLSTLEQGSNDTQLQQLLSTFQSEMASGNYAGAASTLVQLQDISANDPDVSPALNALIQSLSVGSDGASVNANTLSSLLSEGSGYGTGTSSGSQQKLSVDMQSLASLMQYANSTMASKLLQSSGLLSQSAFEQSGGAPVGGAPIALPGLSGFSGLSVPSVGAPSLSVGASSPGLPAVPLADFAIPLAAVAAVVFVYFYRGRVIGLIGSQSLPGVTLLKGAKESEAEGAPVSTDSRKRIELYFSRAVRLMARRGVPKLDSETHREFSSRCEGTPEQPHVGTISSLYEKAKFSGQGVGTPEADLAASELLAMGKEER